MNFERIRFKNKTPAGTYENYDMYKIDYKNITIKTLDFFLKKLNL